MQLILRCLTQVHFNMATILKNIQTIIITTHKLQMLLLSSKEEQINIQTAPGYGTSSYYYQNNAWNGGSSGNNYAQSYQNYSSSDTNAIQSSSSVPGNSFSYQQQYNQWPYYYNHPVPSASGNPVAGNSNTDNRDVSTTSGYSYPSIQPPPPGTTTWKGSSSAPVVPPMQVLNNMSTRHKTLQGCKTSKLTRHQVFQSGSKSRRLPEIPVGTGMNCNRPKIFKFKFMTV